MDSNEPSIGPPGPRPGPRPPKPPGGGGPWAPPPTANPLPQPQAKTSWRRSLCFSPPILQCNAIEVHNKPAQKGPPQTLLPWLPDTFLLNYLHPARPTVFSNQDVRAHQVVLRIQRVRGRISQSSVSEARVN